MNVAFAISVARPLPSKTRRESGHSGSAASCQEETHAPQQTVSLFDHFVGALLEKPRNVKAKRLGGLEIDHQLELRRLLHR